MFQPRLKIPTTPAAVTKTRNYNKERLNHLSKLSPRNDISVPGKSESRVLKPLVHFAPPFLRVDTAIISQTANGTA